MRHYKGYEIDHFETTTGYRYTVSKDGKEIAKAITDYETPWQAEVCGTWKVDGIEQLEMVQKAEAIIDRLMKEQNCNAGEVNEILQQRLTSVDDYINHWIPAMRLEFGITDHAECSILFKYACLNYDLPAEFNPHR